MEFHYSSSTPLTGILHDLSTKESDYYTKELEIFVDSHAPSDLPEKAFDFQPDTWWTSSQSCEPNPFIKFCFKHKAIKLTGFELQSSLGTCRPHLFLFGQSIDNYSFFSHSYSTNMNASSIEYFSFESSEYSKCFQFISTRQSDSCNPAGYRSDIAQFELYGKVKNFDWQKKRIKCSSSFYFLKAIPYVFISLLYQ